MVDATIGVIDHRAAMELARLGASVVRRSHLLVVNTFDAAPADRGAVGATLLQRRRGHPVVFADCRVGDGVDEVLHWLERDLLLGDPDPLKATGTRNTCRTRTDSTRLRAHGRGRASEPSADARVERSRARRARSVAAHVVEDWRDVPLGSRGVPPGWRKYETPGGRPAYDFTVVEDTGRRALDLKSAADHSTIAKEVQRRARGHSAAGVGVEGAGPASRRRPPRARHLRYHRPPLRHLAALPRPRPLPPRRLRVGREPAHRLHREEQQDVHGDLHRRAPGRGRARSVAHGASECRRRPPARVRGGAGQSPGRRALHRHQRHQGHRRDARSRASPSPPRRNARGARLSATRRPTRSSGRCSP